MFQFVTLGAALAAIFSTQVTSNLLESQDNPANQTDANTPGVVEKVGPTGILLSIAALGGGAIAVVSSTRNAKSKSKENIIHIDQASRKLQKQLMILLHDDQDTATRLLSQVKIKNPNKPIDWYVEKVIYDLERDRGSY